ncbi:STAS domain-containing protein [Tolumonas lignilytica]|jgi:Predicted NTP binding protein (contains STAS domain)|uniref:STAS domain-containing protein n=1 Tax=Tolumonas lignilytica TaxID=1283284 RepID=UPI0004677F15|nr:STAS domain-containing protein [Tolumonas lignilytica]
MKLTGSLNAEQVTQLWAERATLFRQNMVDLGTATKIDSAGVAFLVKWAQACQADNQRLSITGASPELVRLLALYGVSTLFDLVSPQ